ncbi:hypothetical protein [Halorubrum luteum]
MMTMMMPPIIEGAIPGMYGLGASLATGWAIHMFHSAALGVVFAGIGTAKPSLVGSTPKSVGVGVAYGGVLGTIYTIVSNRYRPQPSRCCAVTDGPPLTDRKLPKARAPRGSHER